MMQFKISTLYYNKIYLRYTISIRISVFNANGEIIYIPVISTKYTY